MAAYRERVTGFVTSLSTAHKAMIVAALAVLGLVLVLFGRWVVSPSYTVLYSDLDDAAVAGVVDSLESEGVPYRLDRGGSTVLVPRDRLYETRADLAAAGVTGQVDVAGWELFDSEGLAVSDFRQRVDYQRALEGELARTLEGMDAIDDATVRLVLPEDELFAEDQEPTSASVLVDTRRDLEDTEIETVTFLVSSAVEGLETGGITVADARGRTLHEPGSGTAGGSLTKTMRQTQDFERALGRDVEELLATLGGGPASVVVRATLDFDRATEKARRVDPDQQVVRSEQTSEEDLASTGTAPGGVPGVDGGPLAGAGDTETDYTRNDEIVQYDYDEVEETIERAPGDVESLSVAIVMDDGTLTGREVPPVAEVEELVSAAIGLQPARGDGIAVTAVPFPEAEAEEEAAPPISVTELATYLVALLVVLIVAVALFLMTRRRAKAEPAPAPQVEWEPQRELEPPAKEERKALPTPESFANPIVDDVRDIVKQNPEEVAVLLRSWLADRRT